MSKKCIQCRGGGGGKNRLSEDLTEQTAGEPGAAQSLNREQENGAQPVDDDELEAVTGGAAWQIVDAFRDVNYYCKYCDKKFVNMKEARDAHEAQCPENPANQQ